MDKYSGEFNYYGQMFKLWTTAKDKRIAHRNFLFQLVKRLKLDKKNGYGMLRFYFSDRANYNIKKEVEP